MERELLVLKMVLLTASESESYAPSTREDFIEKTCQYGASFQIHPDEVNDVLNKPVQAITLPQSEWR